MREGRKDNGKTCGIKKKGKKESKDSIKQTS
jgi:hypothetical protein